jgi:hypothetical protein
MQKIIKTEDFSVIEKAISSADQDSLVVFDVDDVLITPKDKVLRQNSYIYETVENILGESKSSEILELYSIIFSQRKSCFVDERFVPLIINLQNNGIKTIALTNCSTEKFYEIPSMKDWRIKELESFGYNFGYSWSGVQEIKFENLPTPEEGIFPMFSSGILFTNDIPKGNVLGAFLNHINFKPNHIIFIDDRLKYLESVADIAKNASILYTGIEYIAAEMQANDFCKEFARRQLEILVKEKRWVSALGNNLVGKNH